MSASGRSGRVPRPLSRPLRSSVGAAAAIYRKGDPANEFEAIKYYWQHPAFRALRKLVESVPTLRFGGYTYPRSALLGILLVACLLGIPLSQATCYVQGSKGLRRLFGFAPMTPAARRQQRDLGGRRQLTGDNFPTRQTVSYFLNQWLVKCGCDLVTAIRAQVEDVAAQAIFDHDLDTSRVAVDGARVLSPNRSKRSRRPDPGAEFLKREGERATLGRVLGSVILTDVPLVVVSDVTAPRGESPFIGGFLPQLERFSGRLVEQASARGLSHRGFAGAAVCGDSAFNNTPLIKRLYEHGLEPNFDVDGWPRTTLIGQRLLRHAGGTEVVADLSNDGTLYCSCDRWQNEATRAEGAPLLPRPLSERTPMRQLRGRIPANVYVVCENPLCVHRGLQFYVALGRAADLERGGTLIPGGEDFTVITSLQRADIRVSAMAFKGRQAIESRHSILHSSALLGKSRGRHRRAIYGDTPHRLWYALADLIHNLTIAHNLASGSCSRREIPWDEQYDAKRRNGAQVVTRKAMRRGLAPPGRAPDPPGALPLAA